MNDKPTVDVKTLPVITRFIYTIGTLPTSYMMSMTYEEQVVWLCNYLETTVIPAVNQNGQAVEELQNLYELLREYVNSYFENLDIQEEINNKLEEMSESGELTNLIKDYVDPIYTAYETQINGELSNMDNRIDDIETLVTSLSSGAPTPVSSIDDMVDTTKVYLLLTDGYVYYYNGDTWTRGWVYQAAESSDDVEALEAEVGRLQNIMYYKDLLGENIVEGSRLNRTTGGVVSDANYDRSDFIRVESGQTLYFKGHIDALCYYNANQQSLSSSIDIQKNFTNQTIVVASNPNTLNPVKYLRIAWLNTEDINSDVKIYDMEDVVAKPDKFTFPSASINGNAIVTNTSLTVEGVPADAKAVGDAIANIEDNFLMKYLHSTTCKIFKKVFCIGDSYTSGYINIPGYDSQLSNKEFAWPHYMSTLTGNDWINAGVSGANVLNWWGSRGYMVAQKGNVQLYIIGLMINDVAQVDLGTVDDIGTQSQTYYGGMSYLIERLHTACPTAKIILNGIPKEGTNYRNYTQALADIVDYYDDTMEIYLLDLYQYKDLFTNTSFSGDYISAHYTAIGYEQMAEIYAYILSNYINTHVSDFQNVAFLPYSNA